MILNMRPLILLLHLPTPISYLLLLFLHLLICPNLLPLPLAHPISSSPYATAFSFSLPTFDTSSPLDLYGDARIHPDGTVRLAPTNNTSSSSSSNSAGLLMYPTPLDFGHKPTFSASFDFSISPHRGNGLDFFLAPAGLAAPADLLKRGVPPGVFAVEFDTGMDEADHDINDNHVGVDIGTPVSVRAFNVSAIGMVLASGERIRAWIDFEGEKGVLEIRLNRSLLQTASAGGGAVRPALPFASCHVDLAGVIWQQAMLLGIRTTAGLPTSSASAFASQVVTIYSWNFSLTRAAPYRMHSEPLDPTQTFDEDAAAMQPKQIPVVVVQQGPNNGSGDFYTPNIIMALALGAACGAAIALLVVLLCSAKVQRHPVAPVDDYHSAKTAPTDFGYEKIVVLTELSAKPNNNNSNKDSTTKVSNNNKTVG